MRILTQTGFGGAPFNWGYTTDAVLSVGGRGTDGHIFANYADGTTLGVQISAEGNDSYLYLSARDQLTGTVLANVSDNTELRVFGGAFILRTGWPVWTEKMRVTDGGRMLLGTTDEAGTSKLKVAGNIETLGSFVFADASVQTTAFTKTADADGTLTANSDANVPTQKAVKTYVDNAVIGLFDFKGSTDCSANPNYPAALKGDSYVVTVSGKVGGASGKSVDAGDLYLATADNAGGTEAAVGASWAVLEHNLAGALLAANNLSDLTDAAAARTNLGFTEAAQDAVGAMAGASLAYVDGTPLLARAALIGAITAAQDSNATALGSFTLADLNTALSDADVATGGGTATGTNTGDQTSVTGNAGSATALQTSRNFSIAGGGITAATVSFDGTAAVVLVASDDAGHVTLARMADVATARFIGRATAGTGVPEALTGTQATALLDAFTSGAKGLAPASGGGTANFLRADGTWAAPDGSGSPAGNSGEFQYNNAGAFAGAANVEVDAGNLKLVNTTAPAAPTGGLVTYSMSIAGRAMPHARGPTGVAQMLQAGFHGSSVFMVGPTSGTSVPTAWGGTLTTTGTLSMLVSIASANPWQATQRKRFQTAAVSTAFAGMRTAYTQWFRGNAAGFGGFFFRAQFGQNLNVNGAQVFVGLCASTANLATAAGSVGALLNMIGVGYDTTDASTGNWFLFRNDGSGTATKVDLGATEAARNTTHGYDLIIYCPPGAATEIFVRIVNLHTGNVVLDTSYTTDLPTVNTGMAFKAECNNGAVAAAHNLEVAKVYIESDY